MEADRDRLIFKALRVVFFANFLLGVISLNAIFFSLGATKKTDIYSQPVTEHSVVHYITIQQQELFSKIRIVSLAIFILGVSVAAVVKKLDYLFFVISDKRNAYQKSLVRQEPISKISRFLVVAIVIIFIIFMLF